MFVAARARPFCQGWRWALAALVIGAAPFLVSYGVACVLLWMGAGDMRIGLAWHQTISGVLLAALCLGCALDDAWLKGIAAITLAFLAHALVVIAVSRVSPERSAAVLPDAEKYWRKQIHWIETGEDEEYDVRNWIPAHGTLLAGSTIYSFTSLGAMTFAQGFYQVDLMNYYTAQFIGRSANRPKAAVTAWHIWSLLRGAGYLFITFEVLSLALQVITGLQISTWAVRGRRWLIGLSLLLADCVLKWFLLEAVRLQLWGNLA